MWIKIKDLSKENKAITQLLTGVIIITCIAFVIDWLNLQIMVNIINTLSYKLMLTEWITYVGYFIALLIPIIFFIIGEKRRNEDKKETKELIEKQNISNLITNYKKLYWNDELISILYGQDGSEELKERVEKIQFKYMQILRQKAMDQFEEDEKNDDFEIVGTKYKYYMNILEKMSDSILEEIALINLIEVLITDDNNKKMLSELSISMHEALDEVVENMKNSCEDKVMWPFEWSSDFEL